MTEETSTAAPAENGHDPVPASVTPQPPELGKLGGEAITKFCDAAAEHIEQVRD
jgi:hypothetical protein